jgi:hypothetical protein
MTGQSNGLVTRRSPAAVRVAGVAATIGLLATLLPAGTGHADSDTFDRGYQRSCGASAQAYSPFADVRPNAHNQAVGCLAFLGVSEGRNTSAGRLYQPRSRMLRDQMASLVARTIDLVPNDVYRLPPASEGARFPDVDGVHEDNIRRLVAAEIVEGREDGTYAPRRPVTRAQMASFVARAIEAVTGTELPRAEDPSTRRSPP